MIFPLLINAAAPLDICSTEQDSISFMNKVSRFGESVIDKITWKNDNKILVIYPSGGYSERTGLEFGIMPIFSWENSKNKLWKTGKVNSLSTSFQVSTRGMVQLDTRLECFPSDVWQINANLEWLKINDKFWGVYSEQTLYDGVLYKSERVGGMAEFIRDLNKNISVGMAMKGYNYSFIPSDNDIFIPSNILGYNGGMVSGLGFVAQFDNRNHTLFPSSGFFCKSSYILFSKIIFSDYNYSNLLVDARYYKAIGKSVIASQFLWDYTMGDVPFYMLPQLGGKNRLRGIGHSQRVIDNSIRILRSELRIPIWWRFGAVVFAGIGDARSDLSFNPDKIIFSGGTGIRFRVLPDEPLNVRFDIGFTSTGLSGIYISIKEAF